MERREGGAKQIYNKTTEIRRNAMVSNGGAQIRPCTDDTMHDARAQRLPVSCFSFVNHYNFFFRESVAAHNPHLFGSSLYYYDKQLRETQHHIPLKLQKNILLSTKKIIDIYTSTCK